MTPVVQTVGHSNQTSKEFLDLLQNANVEVIFDVRSSPYSRYTDQFNKEVLQQVLLKSGIDYVYAGQELGARRSEPECYDGPVASYSLIRECQSYKSGIQAVLELSSQKSVCLMCSEKDPITCHRMILIAPTLISYGVGVEHILSGGMIESNDDAIGRLVAHLKIDPNPSLFGDQDCPAQEALQRQAERIAWVRPEEDEFSGVMY